MEQYISKSEVVAEIERLRKNYGRIFNEYDAGFSEGRSSAFDEVLSFLNTLEVKEVEEEPVSNDIEAEFVLYLKRRFNIPQEGNTLKTDGWSPSPYDLLDIAKHFAQWQKKQMINEVCDPFKEPEFTMEIKKKTIEEQIYALTTVLRYSKEEIEKHINVKPLQDLLEQLKQRIGG